jgi:hypothetical protein
MEGVSEKVYLTDVVVSQHFSGSLEIDGWEECKVVARNHFSKRGTVRVGRET